MKLLILCLLILGAIYRLALEIVRYRSANNPIPKNVADIYDSETYGKWYGVELTEENKKQFYISEGFAHGFLVLSETAEFCYKVTDFYHPNDEGGLMYNDPALGVEWPIPEGMELLLSEKDTKHGSFEEYIEKYGR